MSATAATSLYGNTSPRLPRWVNTLLVIALGYAVAVFSLKLLPQPETVTSAPVRAIGSVKSNLPDAVTLAANIARLHVFGDVAAKPAEVKIVEKKVEVKDTKLNLQLAGVFAYEPQERAIAIISAGTAEQTAYGVGDKISGETTLKAVFPQYVLLDNRGVEEKLRLPENVQNTGGARSIPANNNLPQAGRNTQAQANENLNQPVDLPSTPGALRDTLARNPSLLGRVVAAEPYQENGKLLGYRITPKQNPEILEAQGIVAGDVITRVNNIQLNSQKQGIRALRNAVKAENLEVMVLRDGVEIPLNISLAQ